MAADADGYSQAEKNILKVVIGVQTGFQVQTILS